MTEIKRCMSFIVESGSCRPCGAVASFVRYGKDYCKIHNPREVAAMRKKRSEQFDKILNDRLIKERGEMFPVLVDYLEHIAGIKEPSFEEWELRGIAKKVLKKVEEAGL